MLTYMTQTKTTFSDWLLAEIGSRQWSQSELARRAEVSPAAISDVISGRRNIGSDLATAIARGLNIKTDIVFRAAGLLPPVPGVSEEIEQILHEIDGMSSDEKAEILSYIRWRNNQRKKK
jgi:transcriptional regulator with XRE-family HTH domain